MHRLFLIALLAAVLPSCQSKDKDKVVITVHSQGTDMDSPKTIFRRNVEGRTMIFKIIPEFSTQSVTAIHPFPAEDGTYGVALKLDFKGTQSLDLVTRLRSGEMLMTMVNGVPVDHVQINRPVSDGIFTVWRGLAPELVTILEEKYPKIHESSSASTFLEMTPSTRKEKMEAKKRAEAAAKENAEEEKRRARGEFDPEAPEGEVVPLSDLLKSTSR
ncbi:hypothetical protein SAMN02745166_01317 [Prosthecobacter debontii]|uniref:Uncharacterized protein n=1 Tax=Prosthecobacter debontii TaxID=48467 RepID=A0A1T4XBP5_9BACT|nr:hypothetical protein [Prosthecobacter debontii]SKA86595.1 hypothetical protein SAMN02745166_01317 [Prosthecobacter debontii]